MNKTLLHIRGLLVAATTLLAAWTAPQAVALDAAHFADSSRLATGRWVKISVSGTGMHEITADEARGWGFGDLSRVHVFGMGGLPLSERLTEDIPDDLPQLPVVREGNRLLFYAQGTTAWSAENGTLTWSRTQHPYSTLAYYLVTDDSRFTDVEPQAGTGTAAGSEVTTFTEHLLHEVDITNPGETGRTYLGEDLLAATSQVVTFDLKGLVDGSTVAVRAAVGVKPTRGSASMTYRYNGTNLPGSESDQVSATTSNNDNYYLSVISDKTFALTGTTALNYTVQLNTNGTITLARLDYVAVNYTRRLALDGGSLCFDYYHRNTDAQLVVDGADATTQVWDVTRPWQPVALAVTRTGSTVRFSPTSTGHHRYVAFSAGATCPRPSLQGTVSNQNLHGQPVPHMLIITPTEYAAQAQRVAQLHERMDSMQVLVVSQNDIFNEFSGGTPDAMAYRMLCKMMHDRGNRNPGGNQLQYLLLMGKGTFDNRLVTGTVRALRAPMLLTWQSPESLSPSSSYTSDDVFAILSDGSGSSFTRYKLDLAVGRFPVKSVAEAKVAVDKLIAYATTPNYGSWKNNVLNVADDENQGIHMEQAEAVVTNMKANGGEDFIYNRVYIDAFTAVSTGANRTYPDANTKHYNTLRNGVVWWNYTGHSSAHAMTDNGLLRHADLDTKFYYNHLPVLYAATCDFTMFDGTSESGGETLFLNPRGGVIAIVCPPRHVYISNNGVLNESVARYAFARGADKRPLRLGDIVRLGKNGSLLDANSMRYFLLGDPAMRLVYPEHKIKVESIEGANEHTSTGMPVFHGRQLMTVSGSITDVDGNPLPDFNGTISTELYDYEESITSHAYGDGAQFTFLERTNRLGVSIDSVQNGKFTSKLVLPTELMPRNQATGTTAETMYDNFSPSLLNMYAYCTRDSSEAMGSSDRFIIYGYDAEEQSDTIGPTIHYLRMNSDQFASGDVVNESPLVIARVSDESGINYSSAGIGHAMTLTLDGKTTYSDAIDYFTPYAVSSGSAGDLRYQLNDLAAGEHTLRLRAWDVYNNAGEATIAFTVVPGLKPEITDVYASVNPAREETNFYVRHNRPDALINFGIEVFDLMGRLVWKSQQSGVSSSNTSFPITWNLTDMGGRRVPRSIYVYRATISTDGKQETTKSKKIAVTGE